MATTKTKSRANQVRSFTLTLTQGERARAERLADRDDRSLSSLVRLALKDYCDRAEEASQEPAPGLGHPVPLWPRNPFDQHGKKA